MAEDRSIERVKREKRIASCIAEASQGREWLLKTLWALRDQEGGWVGAEVANRDGSHDLGPLQVNSWWVPHFAKLMGRPETNVRRWLTHDACFNVQAARWIFLSGLRRTRSYWKAVGVYHSPTPWRQRNYAASFASKLQRRLVVRQDNQRSARPTTMDRNQSDQP
ncbi:lytic transglycosylase domain-containing protein [Sphingomonas sp. MG17]|uniref:Lytic transglycosylase domain-containing protein n=2 Tax=Sphingomonas tagetis TaxID=2949092 RepID=A0A9X2HW77_9SPHN|nr:lytic transglycosylase domain-containing protein [Sphingomonas tagetis]MCP3733140.1 lytic transglycosylase domain-containing protein [Sphingomonas tagetis]